MHTQSLKGHQRQAPSDGHIVKKMQEWPLVYTGTVQIGDNDKKQG